MILKKKKERPIAEKNRIKIEAAIATFALYLNEWEKEAKFMEERLKKLAEHKLTQKNE